MSGIPYPPPDHILPIFNTEEFTADNTGGLDVAAASNYFVRYPIEVRPISLAGLTTTGTATFSGAMNITSGTASTSTTTGALVVSGGIGVGGQINSGTITTTGNANFIGTLTAGTSITAPTIKATTNGLYANDGANEGRVYQSSTELILSSSGNKVAIANNNSLTFKNDSSIQYTAYTAREILDDCDAHTYIYNAANPSTLKYMLSSTFPIFQLIPTNTYAIAAINRCYFFPIRLIKGQVVNGAGFYLTTATAAPTVSYGLYTTSSPAARATSTATFSATVGTSMFYQNFATSYTVPTTGVYYVGIVATNFNGGTLNMVAVPTNTYLNYGQTTMTAGVLDKASQYVDTGGGFLNNLAGLTPVIDTRVGYAVVYTTSAV